MRGLIIRLALIALVMAACARVQGQQGIVGNRILFRGVVISADSGERLPGSQIFINRLFTASSQTDGTFSFFASKLDTVNFTMLGYKTQVMIVSDTLNAREFLTGVYLRADTLDAGEVVVIPRLTSLKADLVNPRIDPDVKLDNARANLSIASYQGRAGQNRLGDPSINYEVMRNLQKKQAYEKGGIPSDRIVGLSPFMLIPAAYLLIHGLPEPPDPPEPIISSKDLEDLNKRYFESLRKEK